MKKNLYVIFDAAAEECGPVFEAGKDRVAIRKYEELMSRTTANEDFDLFKVGIIDSETMLILPVKPEVVRININVGEVDENE